MSRLLAATTFATVIQALAFDGKPARATDIVVPDRTFHSSQITPGPNVKDLLRRDTVDQTVYVAPDNTCGYVDGRAGAVFTCNGDYTCGIFLTESFGRAGCFSGSDYGLRATCYGASQLQETTGLCDDGCLQDTYTLKCTESSAPFCGTVTFFSSAIDFYCNALGISTPQQIYTTYNGQTNAQRWDTTVIGAGDSNGTDSATGFETATDDPFTFTESTSSSPSFTNRPGSGGDGDNNNGNGNGNAGSGDNNSGGNGDNGNGSGSSKKSRTPIAAIVGGVVGGVGGIALIGLAIFLLIRRNNKKKAVKPTNPEQPMQQTGGVPPPPPPGGPSGYQNNAPYGQPPYSQQTPPPNPYHQPEEHKPAGFVGLAPAGVPDRHDSTSPVSQFSDPRFSAQPHSPTSTLTTNWAGQHGQSTSPTGVPHNFHEAASNVVGQKDYNAVHHGQFHEMAS